MLKKTITYTDYNGLTRTEDFYFNLNKAELAMMNLSAEGGLQETLMPIVNRMDVPKLAEFFEKLIMQAYGEKSPDGKRFIKSPELSQAFKQSEAYSEMFMEMFMGEDGSAKAAEFLMQIMPKDMQRDAAQAMKEAENQMPVKFPTPAQE